MLICFAWHSDLEIPLVQKALEVFVLAVEAILGPSSPVLVHWTHNREYRKRAGKRFGISLGNTPALHSMRVVTYMDFKWFMQDSDSLVIKTGESP